jgi:hypothetical protein
MSRTEAGTHSGYVERRKWYKVLWTSGPHKGKVDLLMDLEIPPSGVEILKEIVTRKCTSGLRIGFGNKTEQEIDIWIRENSANNL